MARAKLKVTREEKGEGAGTLAARALSIKRAGKVKVGVLAEGKGEEEEHDSELTVAQLAVILEFGTEDGHIKPRSFVRSTFDEQADALAALSEKLMDRILDGKITAEQGLGIMGLKLANEIKKKVTSGPHIQPENAESTVRQKGSDRPLVDHSQVVNAVTWGKDEGGGE